MSPEPTVTGAPAGATASEAVPPVVVVRGAATPEEVAALVAVLSAASGGEEAASEESPSAWAAHAASLRRPVGHGPGAWRNSLRS